MCAVWRLMRSENAKKLQYRNQSTPSLDPLEQSRQSNAQLPAACSISMVQPYTSVDGHVSRAQLMLTAGGGVVRVGHDSVGTGNRLMVPTEHELKTILYDQAGVRGMIKGHCNNDINDVTLHAERRAGRTGSNNLAAGKNFFRNRSRVAAAARGISGRRACAAGRPHVRRQQEIGSSVGLRSATVNPADEESEEDVDVSLFMDSFLALRVPSKFPKSATERLPFSVLSACGDKPDRQARGAPAVGTAQATMAMCEPLAQIDLYRILARAPPAEIRRAAPRGSGGVRGRSSPTDQTKNGKKHRRKSASLLAGTGRKGDRKAFKAAGFIPRKEMGEYQERDPLGDEVAELDAKIQQDLRRVRRDAEKAKYVPNIDIGRHYAELFADTTSRANGDRIAAHNEDDGPTDTQSHRVTTVASVSASAFSAAAAVGALRNQSDLLEVWRGRSCTGGSTGGCRLGSKNSRTRRQRIKGNEDQGKIGAPSAGNRERMCGGAARTYFGKDNHEHHVSRLQTEAGKEGEAARPKSSTRPTREATGKAVEPEESETDERSNENANNVSEIEQRVPRGKRHRRAKRHGRAKEEAQLWSTESDGYDSTAGGEGQQWNQQIRDGHFGQNSRNPSSSGSDHDERSSKSTNGLEEGDGGSVASGIDGEENVYFATQGGVDGGLGKDNGRRAASPRSVSRALKGWEGSADNAAAAALRIEACWRGFLGRCAAKYALRFALLDALRKIGGGKISKVLTLADIEQQERRELRRALRVATLPRHLLPSQAHIIECIRFVELQQRRRAGIVEARKRRWVAERRRRKQSENYGYALKHVAGL